MIRILLILLDDLIGGTPMRILKIAKYINKSKFKIIVAIPEGSGDFGSILEDAGITVYRLKVKRLRYKLNPVYLIEWLVNFPKAFGDVCGLIRENNVDIVHAFGLTQVLGPLAAKKMAKKVIWQVNDLVTPFHCLFVSLAKNLSDAIAVSSDAVKRHYFGLIPSRYSDKIVKLYSAIDPQVYLVKSGRNRIRKEFGIGTDAILIGTIGNLNKFKGHLDFIKACHYIKNSVRKSNVRFIIVGRILKTWESYYKQLLATAEKLGLKHDIVFTGARLDIPDLLSAMDIYVQPSISESFGLSILEAMAAGKPVVATNVGGIPEIIPDERFGILVPPSEPLRMAEAILRYMEDLERANEIGDRGSKRVAALFNIETFIKRHEDLYVSLQES